MKESEFIDQNKNKWLHYEKIIKQTENDPDELSDVFIQVTDDLSHSRSQYPNRSVRVYLNDLASKIFDKLGKRKKLDFGVIKDFYTIEVPQLMYLARREMLISFVIFILSMGIGIYSSIQNPEFASIVLGESYVQMTQENISKGEAMDVYTGGSGMEGFLRILENNARIDIMMLGVGVFFSFGAIWVLVRNGIMVGVFQFFFFQNGGFKDSLLTIWLHGTIEITTIALMGGVALLAGKGLLFPGTYTRYQSFRLSAGNAGKLLLMVLPFTFIAAVIEGFITRMTHLPDFLKGVFILISLALVVIYFFVYPRLVHKKHGVNPLHERLRKEHPPIPISLTEVKNTGQIIVESFATYKENFGKNILICALAGLLYPVIVYFKFEIYFSEHFTNSVSSIIAFFQELVGNNSFFQFVPETFNFKLFRFLYVGFWILMLFFVNAKWVYQFKLHVKAIPQYLLIAVSLLTASYLYINRDFGFPLDHAASFAFFGLIALANMILLQAHYYKSGVSGLTKTFFSKLLHISLLWLAASVVIFFIQLLVNSFLAMFVQLALNDLLPFGAEVKGKILTGVQLFLYMTVMIGSIPFFMYASRFFVLSNIEKYHGVHVKEEVQRLNFETK